VTRLLGTGLVAAAAALLGAGAAAAVASPRAQNSRSVLASDAQYGVKGRVSIQRRPATRRAPVREIVVLRMQRLVAAGTYTLFADSPLDLDTTFQQIEPYEVVALRNRTATVKYDSATEAPLPFGATLDQLAGQRIQVRDGDGNVVLAGTFPAFRTR
jgi:hypothetical protein